jgi:hypothetical protein
MSNLEWLFLFLFSRFDNRNENLSFTTEARKTQRDQYFSLPVLASRLGGRDPRGIVTPTAFHGAGDGQGKTSV